MAKRLKPEWSTPQYWDRLVAQSGGVGGQSEALIRAFQAVTGAIVRFDEQSGAQSNVLTGLSVAMLLLATATFYQSCSNNAAAPSTGPSPAPTTVRTVLRCDYVDRISPIRDVYALDESAGTARLLSVEPPRAGGILSATETSYRITFPEDTEKVLSRLQVEINRFTRRASRTLGLERTLQVEGKQERIEPLQHIGECVRFDAARERL